MFRVNSRFGICVRSQQTAGIGFLIGWDLDFDAADGHGITLHAEGGELVGDRSLETGGVKLGADELGFGGIERSKNSDEIHDLEGTGGASRAGGAGFASANTMTPAPVCSRDCTCTWI